MVFFNILTFYVIYNFVTGNLSAALDVMLQRNHINYILTADSCPLPNNITFMPDLKIKFVQSEFIIHYFYAL